MIYYVSSGTLNLTKPKPNPGQRLNFDAHHPAPRCDVSEILKQYSSVTTYLLTYLLVKKCGVSLKKQQPAMYLLSEVPPLLCRMGPSISCCDYTAADNAAC